MDAAFRALCGAMLRAPSVAKQIPLHLIRAGML